MAVLAEPADIAHGHPVILLGLAAGAALDGLGLHQDRRRTKR